MRTMSRIWAILLCLCLIAPCAALAEETALALTDATDYEVVSAPVEAALEEEEFALQPDAPQEAAAVSAPEEDAQPKGSGVKINKAHFPDKIFRKYVSDTFDTNHDGYLSKQERKDAFVINVSSMGISSLKGMEYFPDLGSLFCANNKLTSLDLSKNPGVSELNCENNNLRALDISNRWIWYLYCAGNRISRLDISQTPSLVELYKTIIEGKGQRREGKWIIEYDANYELMSQMTFSADMELVLNGKVVDGGKKIVPTSVRLNKSGTVALKMNKTLQLKATLSPRNAKSTMTWESSKKKVATVSKNGVVKPKKPGTTTITVRTANGKTAKVKVKVVAVKPTKVKITKGTKATMRVGGKLALKAKLLPAGATSKLTWKSSDTNVATVSKSGVVKAKKKGTATITVKTANGKKATIKITVDKRVDLAKYFYGDIFSAAKKLGMKVHSKTMQIGSDPSVGDAIGYYCENKDILLSTYSGGHRRVCCIILKRPSKYRIWGVGVGIDWSRAKEILLDNMHVYNFGEYHYDFDGTNCHIYFGNLDRDDDYGNSSVWFEIMEEAGKVTKVNLFPSGA